MIKFYDRCELKNFIYLFFFVIFIFFFGGGRSLKCLFVCLFFIYSRITVRLFL